MKKFISILIPLALVLFVYAGAEKAISLNKDYPVAPDFTITDLFGNEISLSDYEGKVVLLNFWATWCAPCRAEIPDFIEIYEKYRDKGLVILGISLDSGNENKIRNFVKEYKISYPVAKGALSLARKYESGRLIPETIIIDREGKIRHKHTGPMSKETIEKYFLDLSKEM
jgi:cytochrome c biogenesis protein CcmG/thiol:disulfide interchange protein DsbE